MNFDISKTYKTRGGKKVKLYLSEAGGAFPVHGAIFRPGNGWDVCCWALTGWRVSPGQAHPDDILGEWTENPGRMLAWVSANGVLGLFEDGQTPDDVKNTGKRIPWLDEPEAKNE